MRRGKKTPDDLSRPDGNGLKKNYEKHDIGHREIEDRLNEMGCVVEEWGIDMRHDDGEDGIIYDDKMDMKVFYGGELVAIMDVKTKGSPKYMGRFNERHYTHYYGHAIEYDVPVYVVMMQVDYQRGEIYDEFVFRVGDAPMYENVISSTDSRGVRSFPDGNEAVLIKHEHRKPWEIVEWDIERQIKQL